MAMTTGPGAQINVTPMIDVLLVLIIIFMVILPNRSEGLNTQVPQESESSTPPPAVQLDIIVTVEREGEVLVNQDRVQIAKLADRLQSLFNPASRPVVFVKGNGSLPFQDIAEVIDVAKGVGFTRVALLTS
jgi:biopolymer transport protein ExbD